jgi:hypothetical protein
VITSEQEIVVHRSVTVPLPTERAFTLFTERMGAFWPSGYSIGTAATEDVLVEPRAGGRWYERGVDGSECDWGRVAEWAPPGRVVLLWQITGEWRYDPEFATEVEVSFTDAGAGTSRVDLRHRHLERFGEHTDAIRATFDSPGGWAGILARFADLAQ